MGERRPETQILAAWQSGCVWLRWLGAAPLIASLAHLARTINRVLSNLGSINIYIDDDNTMNLWDRGGKENAP